MILYLHKRNGTISDLCILPIFHKAELGVWYNGEERVFLRKIEKDGKVFFEEIPNIPRYGQKV